MNWCLTYDYDELKVGTKNSSAVSNFTGAGKEDKVIAFMCFDDEGNECITKAELLKVLKANHMASHDAEVAKKLIQSWHRLIRMEMVSLLSMVLELYQNLQHSFPRSQYQVSINLIKNVFLGFDSYD